MRDARGIVRSMSADVRRWFGIDAGRGARLTTAGPLAAASGQLAAAARRPVAAGRPPVTVHLVATMRLAVSARIAVAVVLAAAIVAGPAAGRPLLLGVDGNSSAGAIAGEGNIYFSGPDHQSWTPATGVNPALVYTSVLAASSTQFFVTTESGTVWRSNVPQATGFFERATVTSVPLRAMTEVGSRLLVVGDGGTIARSASLEGASWVLESSPVTTTLRGVATNGLTSSVAVGDQGTIVRGGQAGNNWVRVDVAETGDFLAVVADLDGQYIAVGTHGILWEGQPDGQTWTRLDSGVGATLRGITRIANRLVVVGDAGTIYYSDGALDTWYQASVPLGVGNLYAVAFAETGVIAVGERNVALWSFTGLDWTIEPTAVLPMSWGRVKQIFRAPAR